VRADMVTYGKTVAGGLPSACCAEAMTSCAAFAMMARRCLFRARHVQCAPLRDGAMFEFLKRLDKRTHPNAVPRFGPRLELARRISQRTAAGAQLPLQVANLSRYGPSATASRRATIGCFIIPARRRSGVELGGHRPADLQSKLPPLPTSRR